MADHDSIVSSDKLKAIADAIRDKTKKEHKMTLDEMPTEIESISGGGGVVPECGIVPTEYSDKGFVLSADSYGDIQSNALMSPNSSIYDPVTTYSSHSYIPDTDTSATIYNNGYSSGSIQYRYLASFNYKTNPTIIGSSAFYNCHWLDLPKIPDTVEYIGYRAFSQCNKFFPTEIPASVKYVGSYAFSECARLDNITPRFDSTKTYIIGDTVYFGDCNYTCKRNTSVPAGEITSHDWILGYYPKLIGEYDPEVTYATGDIVCIDDAIYTIVDYPSRGKTSWVVGYAPTIKGAYSNSETYNLGDVVCYDGYIYTCIVNISTPEDFDEYHWILGEYPTLAYSYDSDAMYGGIGPNNVGDVAYINDDNYVAGVFTCVNQIDEPGDFNESDWVTGYAPHIIGPYDDSRTYNVGDVVSYSEDYGNEIFTCISPVESPSDFNSDNWYDSKEECPNISIADYETQYNLGDCVVSDFGGAGSDPIYTCLNDGVMFNPGSSDFYRNWINGYYPQILGEYNKTRTYSVGDVTCILGDQDEVQVRTVYYRGTPSPQTLVPVYYPDFLGVYDPNREYVAGDVVFYTDHDVSDDTSAFGFYYCISNEPIVGKTPAPNSLTYWSLDTRGSGTSQPPIPTVQFLNIPDTIGVSCFGSNADSPVGIFMVPWGIGDKYNFDRAYSMSVAYLCERVCTGLEFIFDGVITPGDYTYHISTLHHLSSDLSLPDKGNLFDVSIISDKAEIWYGSMASGFTIRTTGITAGEVITLKATSIKDPTYSITQDITVITPSWSFDSLDSGWYDTETKYSGYEVYRCYVGETDNVCELNVYGYRRFRIYCKCSNSFAHTTLYVGHPDRDVSTETYAIIKTMYTTDYQEISYDMTSYTSDLSVPHTVQVMLCGNSEYTSDYCDIYIIMYN